VVTKIMGLLLFLLGLGMLLIATLASLGITEPHDLLGRLLVFGGGLLLSVMGYLMAREKLGAPD
jgi:hypothetical protein